MYNKIVVSIIFRGHLRVEGVLYSITKKLKHVCIIGNIFVNIQTILTTLRFLHQNVMFLMNNINIEKR